MITQEEQYTGCGIATFANAAGLDSFYVAKEWMESINAVKSNGFVTIPQMKLALELKLKRHISIHNSLSKLGQNAVLFVIFSKKYNERHWIYYSNGYYYDPINKDSKPTKKLKYKVTRLLNING